MYHTLKTLYQWSAKHDPYLMGKFTHLETYCLDSDVLEHKCKLNRGYKSLKWFIYQLRPQLPQEQLEQAYLYCLIEAAVRGENYLYDDIMKLTIAKDYRHLLEKSELDFTQYELKTIGAHKILINETPANITSLIFKRRIADCIIFRTPAESWAGIIFDVRNSDVLDFFDINKIYAELKKRTDEPWILMNNLILCGGPKAPGNKTSITTHELFLLLTSYYKRGEGTMNNNTSIFISEESKKWYEENFNSIDEGIVFASDILPTLYQQKLDELAISGEGNFTHNELCLIVDLFNGLMLTPQLAGQQLLAQVEDGIELDHMDEKWKVDKNILIGKIESLQISDRAFLEIWASFFWYGNKSGPKDFDSYVTILAE